MIELPRITVTDANSNYLTSIDNNVDDALHYSSTKLHTYLTGTASTLDFTVTKTTDDFSKIKEGCKLFFIYNEKQYALNVMRIEEDDDTMVITALSLSLELNNKEVDEYKADKQMEIQEYISIFDTQGSLTIGTNELDYRRTLEWEGSSSLLARLLSLATKFDAEIQFTTVVDNLFNITATVIDIYKKNGDGNQGIGQYRPEIKLSYGQNVKTIKRTVDITELQTSIRPIGKDGLTLIGKNYEEYNEDNELEYFSFKESGWIYAPFARDRFPSTTTGKNPDDRFMGATWDYDTDKQDTLYSQALARLKKISEPTVTYEVEGYFDLSLGDTVRIYDDKFNPPLMLEARVSEQEIDFTNPENNKTTFTNFKVLESEIAQSLLDRMNALIAQNKTYNCIIVTDNGNTFKNGKGETTLIARVLDGIKNVTNDFKYQWFKDDVELSTDYMVRIEAKDVPDKAVYRYEATRISDGKIIGGAEITVVNNDDGEQGEPGKDAYTGYLTNEAINITADWEGNVSVDDLRSAVGQFILFKGSAILSNITYSILAQQDMIVTIDNEGNYAVTAIDKDYAFAKFKAVTKDEDNKEIAIQKTLTVTKSRNGKPGENGKGKDGIDAISARLTLPFATVTADTYGTVTQSSLNQIKGNFIVYEGQSEVVTDIEYSVENQFGMSVAIDKLTGAYYVTSINQNLDTATAILKAKYKEIEIKQIFGVSKSKIGKTGTEGIPGVKGADGKTPYLHIAYATSADGKAGFSTTVSNGKTYIGTYTDYTTTDSTDSTKYTWLLIKGEQGPQGLQGVQGPQGDQGIQGPKGNDGKSSYTHIAYANIVFLCKENSSFTLSETSLVRYGSDTRWVYKELQAGTYTANTTLFGQDPASGVIKNAEMVDGFSVSNYIDKAYIGVYVDNIELDSTDPSKYNWTLIKGADGAQGILVKDTPPIVPTINQLWQNSGVTNGYVLNRIYRWTGSDWTTHYFYADNIVANTLAAINSQLGTIFAGQMFFSRYNNQWSKYDRLIHGAGMYHDSEQILFYRDKQNYVGLDYKGIKMCTNGTIYYLTYQDNGFNLMPDSLNTPINSQNTGLDLYGKSTYIDLRNQLTGQSADYGGRLWMHDNKYVVELIANIGKSPSHVWLTARNGGSVNLNSASVNVMDELGINHSPVYASNIGNVSSRKVKYNIKELSDVHDDFKALELKSYRQVSPRSNYQIGIVLEDNIKMPFTDTKSGTIDLYSYATFIAKALQEEIAKRELLEEKITKLEEKLNDVLQTD